MVDSTRKSFIVAAINAFDRDSDGDRKSAEDRIPPYKELAKAVMEVCPRERPRKYASLGDKLAPIATAFDIGDLNKRDQIERAKIISEQRKDLADGKWRSLAAPLLYWLDTTHPDRAQKIYKAGGFDAEATRMRIESTLPHVSGIAAYPQNKNPFNREYMLANATERVVLMAQNHWQIVGHRPAGSSDFWLKIKSAIQRGVIIEIVAMHPEASPPIPSETPPDAIDLWGLYMKAPLFRAHVTRCWKEFSRFEKLYGDMRPPEEPDDERKLIFHRTYFNPISMAMMDPKTDKAMIVMSPRTANEVSGTRPEFVIRKEDNEDTFLYYESFIENALVNQATG